MSPEHKPREATNALPDGGAEDGLPTKPEDIAYPPGLRDVEDAIQRLRPKWALSGNSAQVGIGLSGGGIRSATFCLGVFQAFAKRKLLGEIDYLSSVSGGSYFASFCGRLFSRQTSKDWTK